MIGKKIDGEAWWAFIFSTVGLLVLVVGIVNFIDEYDFCRRAKPAEASTWGLMSGGRGTLPVLVEENRKVLFYTRINVPDVPWPFSLLIKPPSGRFAVLYDPDKPENDADVRLGGFWWRYGQASFFLLIGVLFGGSGTIYIAMQTWSLLRQMRLAEDVRDEAAAQLKKLVEKYAWTSSPLIIGLLAQFGVVPSNHMWLASTIVVLATSAFVIAVGVTLKRMKAKVPVDMKVNGGEGTEKAATGN